MVFSGAMECETLVAGGGVAGVAAAVAAARAGSRTVLIERESRPGGTGTRGMLRTVCGLYLNGPEEPTETLNGGLAREIAGALRVRAPHRAVARIGKVFVLPYASEDLISVLEALCRKEAALTLLFECTGESVTREGAAITEIAVRHEGVSKRIRPRSVIDCTGNGNIAALAGAAFELAGPDEIQMAGYTVRLRGLSGRDEALALKVPYVLGEAAANGKLLPSTRFTTFSSGDEPDEGFLKFSTDGTGGAGREQRMRDEAERATAVLAGRLPAFRNAAIAETSRGVLDREGRRVVGEYILTEDDVLSARKFPDAAVKNSWPIELWDRTKGPVFKYLPEGDYYEIPFRCLAVKGFSNLLVAGRCISVSHEALGSTRVMGTCMALGDAAGRAAAGLVKNGKYTGFKV